MAINGRGGKMDQIGGNELITAGEGVALPEDRDLESILERSRTVIKVVGSVSYTHLTLPTTPYV